MQTFVETCLQIFLSLDVLLSSLVFHKGVVARNFHNTDFADVLSSRWAPSTEYDNGGLCQF